MGKKIKNVLVLGCGTMGQQIGLQFAVSGFDVVIFDIFEESLEKGKKRIPRLAEKMAGFQRFSKEDAEKGLKRISFSSDYEEAGKNADLINESVPEDPKLKAEIFAKFNKICPEHTIFTTNTSTLIPSMFAKETGRPEKFAALHFHDLAMTNLVDIMPHKNTSKETLELIRNFCSDSDLFAIELKKEQHGYVFNTMLTQLLTAALSLASKGVASPEDIDKAWMGVMRTHLGPFGIIDSVGIETVWKITDYWAKTLGTNQGKRNAEFLKKYVDEGLLGMKSKKGFYSYPNPKYLNPDFLSGIK